MSEKPKSIQRMGEEFMLLLGTCITEWANIEDELYLISRLILSLDAERAAIVFFRSPSIDARLTLVSDLVKTVFRPSKGRERASAGFVEWDSIEKEIKKRLPERNQMAHSSVAPVIFGGEFNYLAGKVRFESRKNEFDLLRRKSTDKGLTVDDLRSHLTALSHLINRLRDFRMETLRKVVPAYPTGGGVGHG